MTESEKALKAAAGADAARIAGIAKRKGRTIEEQIAVEAGMKEFLLDMAGDDPDVRITVGGVVVKEKKDATN